MLHHENHMWWVRAVGIMIGSVQSTTAHPLYIELILISFFHVSLPSGPFFVDFRSKMWVSRVLIKVSQRPQFPEVDFPHKTLVLPTASFSQTSPDCCLHIAVFRLRTFHSCWVLVVKCLQSHYLIDRKRVN